MKRLVLTATANLSVISFWESFGSSEASIFTETGICSEWTDLMIADRLETQIRLIGTITLDEPPSVTHGLDGLKKWTRNTLRFPHSTKAQQSKNK